MPTAHIEYMFDIGDFVYLKHDPDQRVRQVTSWRVYTAGEIIYVLAQGSYSSEHYAFEMARGPDTAMKTTN